MSSRLMVAAGAACCVVLTVAAVHGAALPNATHTVSIDARCAGPRSTEVSLRPWNLQISQGDDVQWTLNASANTNEFTVAPKATWPFASNRPVGTKTTPANSSGMRPASRGRYSYTVRLVCQSGSAPADTIVIDPDVIVD